MPHPVTGKAVICVGAVVYVGQSVNAQVLLNGAARRGQQRANQIVPTGGDTGQTTQTAAPNEVEQDGLRVVIGVVGGGDHIRVHLTGRLTQKGVAHLPGGLLQPCLAPGGLPGHIAGADDQRHIGTAAGDKGTHKLLIPGRLRAAQIVVVVCGHQSEGVLGAQGVEPVEQTHGVRTA